MHSDVQTRYAIFSIKAVWLDRLADQGQGKCNSGFPKIGQAIRGSIDEKCFLDR